MEPTACEYEGGAALVVLVVLVEVVVVAAVAPAPPPAPAPARVCAVGVTTAVDDDDETVVVVVVAHAPMSVGWGEVVNRARWCEGSSDTGCAGRSLPAILDDALLSTTLAVLLVVAVYPVVVVVSVVAAAPRSLELLLALLLGSFIASLRVVSVALTGPKQEITFEVYVDVDNLSIMQVTV